MRLQNWFRVFPLRLRALFRRGRMDRELDDELRDHVERKTAHYVTSGMAPDAARRQVRIELGGIEQTKERCRDQRRVAWLQDFVGDARYGVRILAKNWRPASIAAFSLAVAMALSVAGLGVFNGVLLRRPVASNPGQLVTIYTATPRNKTDGVSYPDYEYYRDHNHSFSGVAAYPLEASLVPMSRGKWEGTGTVEQTSNNYFAVMGIQPFLGRFFTPGDKNEGEAVITYSCWRRWGADPKIVGETFVLNRQTLTIVGVAPPDFTGVVFGFSGDVILPLAASTDRNDHSLLLFGRLKPGVTQERARADVETLAGQLAAAYPEANKDRAAVLTPARAFPPDGRSTATLISGLFLGAVLLVLLIACANVANLLLGLATGRRQEMLIRAAVGATRGRLVRQLLTESTILCAVGGAAGFLLATAALGSFAEFSAPMPVVGTLHFAADFQTNGTVAIMTLAVILIASLAAGLAPALHAASTNVAGALSGEVVGGSRRKNAMRHVLVAIQIAVCTLVLVGVGLCLRSLQNLMNVKLGFSARNLASVPVELGSRGRSETQGLALYAELRRSAVQLGGVRQSTLADEVPLSSSQWSADKVLVGRSDRAVPIPTNVVDGNYFATFGIPLLAGRTFNSADTEHSPEVAIISNDMARTYWPGASPIGRHFRIQNGNRMVTVVGVVGDCKYNSLDEPLHPVIYFALSQDYSPQSLLTVRTQGDPRRWLEPLSAMVRHLGVSANIPPFTWAYVMYFNLLVPRLALWVVSVLGALALLLAVVGLYGAIFYSVNERRREIAIRAALGAQPSALVGLFLRQTAVISGVGATTGLLLGVGATIVFRSEFYGIGTVELSVLIPVALAMALISMAIAYAAARPRIKADPMEAVRHT